ncbi:hypothetical protein V490_07211 [Pseudogymnoascus sp. VKM F-3557]|nr:hypothetical protein V490_07211 [Pseudogymnoascus sp. VKM F-3557]
MADQNSYLMYKRDTRRLIYWLVHASNSIIKSLPAVSIPEATLTTLNTTGEIKVSALVPIPKLIAAHINPIPPTIYRLFQSVIAVRTATHLLFQQAVSKTHDPEIERSNATHKHFIDTLTEAFESLGGKVWASQQKPNAAPANEEDEHEVIFSNKFSVLDITGSKSGDETDENTVEGTSDEKPQAKNPKRKPANKATKGKRRNKWKSTPKSGAKGSPDEELPFESYRIIEDTSGLITDYLIAVFSISQQWAILRRFLQRLWIEVSYKGLNSAVAGTLCNIATAMIKQTESAIFVDFPGGHESYETVTNTITRGDKRSFRLHLFSRGDDGAPQEIHDTLIDVKEELMAYAYRDLLDFITDFQKTRSGKPTKSMLAEIRNWDPKYDLQHASKEQRIKWRRSYTINWLYDLVNVYSSSIIAHYGQKHDLETVDWRSKEQQKAHRTLFGLNDFAGEITSFAMQKHGTDVRPNIFPRHVFQLQCIVDSFAVCRGWSLNTYKGHVITAPAQEFRPQRDIDLFLDREDKGFGHGYSLGVSELMTMFKRDAVMHGDLGRHKQTSYLLKCLCNEFHFALGESTYAGDNQTVPPSRFSNTNSNGLWEYSPYLSGVGLVEALELSYSFSSAMWERIPEPTCAIHLYNMLVQKGYITLKTGLYPGLIDMSPAMFFAGGKVPTSNFSEAFSLVCGKGTSSRAFSHAFKRNVARATRDFHEYLNPRTNHRFGRHSFLRLYHDAEWIPERIPDEVVPGRSMLGLLRMCRSKTVLGPAVDKTAAERTPLIAHAIAEGVTDELLGMVSGHLEKCRIRSTPGPDRVLDSRPAHDTGLPLPERMQTGSGKSNGMPNNLDLLETLRADIFNDVCGKRPLSAISYVWATSRMMIQLTKMEMALKRLRNPLYVRAYEQDPWMAHQKRVSLVRLVLSQQDEECMEIMAKEFQEEPAYMEDHIYWDLNLTQPEFTSGDRKVDDETDVSFRLLEWFKLQPKHIAKASNAIRGQEVSEVGSVAQRRQQQCCVDMEATFGEPAPGVTSLRSVSWFICFRVYTFHRHASYYPQSTIRTDSGQPLVYISLTRLITLMPFFHNIQAPTMDTWRAMISKSRFPIVTASHVVKVPKNFLIFRSLQLSLALLVLGISIYGAVIMITPISGVVLSLITSLCTTVVASYTMVATYGDVPRVYNYWAILSLEAILLAFWLLSFSFLALPIAQAFYFVHGGQAGRYSRYDTGYITDEGVIAFIDLMMVSVVVGVIEFILYFITLVTFSTIVHYHRREHRHCSCGDLEAGQVDIESDSKTNSEKAQTEPEPLMSSGDEASPVNGSLDLTTPETTTPEEVVYGEEQRHTEQSNLNQQTPSPPPGESDDDTTNLRHRHIDNPADDFSSNDDHDKYDYDDTTFAYHERIQHDCQPVQIA